MRAEIKDVKALLPKGARLTFEGRRSVKEQERAATLSADRGYAKMEIEG